MKQTITEKYGLMLKIFKEEAIKSGFDFSVYDEEEKDFDYGIGESFLVLLGVIEIYKRCNEDDSIYTNFMLMLFDADLDAEEKISGDKYTNSYRDDFYRRMLNGDSMNFGYFNFLKIYQDNKEAFQRVS